MLASGDPAAAQESAPGKAIRATTTEVLLDLVIRDKHGKQVKNLKAGDVQILEDGVPQKILSVRYATPRDERQAKGAAEQQSTSRLLRAVNPVCIVFHNLAPVARGRAIEAVQELLKHDLQPDTYLGMFVLTDRFNAVYPFTNNREELMQALPNVFSGRTLDFARASQAVLTANPNQVTIATIVAMSTRTAATTVRLTGGEVSSGAITGADVSTGPGANAQRGDEVLQRDQFSNIEGRRQTDQIITMINQLGALPGRKSVLLLTTGLTTTGDPDRFESILAKANDSDISVYALDVRGLDETSTTSAANLALGQVAGTSRTQTQASMDLGTAKGKSRGGDTMLERAVRTSDVQASLRELSEGTGGFLIANTNDFRKPFQRLVEDVNSHYEVAYGPRSDRYDGRLRKIEVKLASADLSVQGRSGYFAVPDVAGSRPASFENIALAALNANPQPHAFDFRSAAFHFRNDQGMLVFEVPGASLAATPIPGRQMQSFHVSLLALVKRADGQVVDTFNLDAPYQIPDANVPAVRSNSITYTHPVKLPPGRYSVETAVLDREGGRASTSIVQFERPAGNTVGISSLVLVQRVEAAGEKPDLSDPLVFKGKRAIPLLAGTVPAQSKPYVYFVVYPNQSNPEKPKIQIQFLAGGQVVADQAAALPESDANGTIAMMVGALTSRPGDCELRITAIQGNETAAERLAYTVR